MKVLKKIKKDYKKAFKNKNKIKKDILNYIRSQIKDKKIAIDGDFEYKHVIKVIKKEIKSRKESLDYLEKSGKDKQIKQEKRKIEILKEYLPDMLDEKELKQLVKEQIKEKGIDNPKANRGEIIQPIMKKHRPKVDGGLLNQVINEL